MAQKPETAAKRKAKLHAERAYNREHYGTSYTAVEIKYRYECTLIEFKERMESSDGMCQICEATEALCYDHCHVTGDFRGVLCRPCNSALGHLGDDLRGVMRAVKYLEGVEL